MIICIIPHVAKIKKSKEATEKGDFIRVEKADLQKFLGL